MCNSSPQLPADGQLAAKGVEEEPRQQAEAEKQRKEWENSIDSIIADWQSFWLKLGIKADLSAVEIPEYQPGFNRILIIPEGLTLNQAIQFCKDRFPVFSYNDDLDKAIVINDRLPTQAYAVCLRDRQEADEELKYLSADALAKEKIAGITLLERLVYELKYFNETSDHLDKKSLNSCSGSRNADGLVPCVGWYAGQLHVDRYRPSFVLNTSRAVVLGERQRKAAEEEQQRQQAEAERKRKEWENSIDSIIADWQSFWQKLGIKVDLSAVEIPEYQPGFSRILIIPEGLTSKQAIQFCKGRFPVLNSWDDLDKAIVANDCRPTQAYAVCLRDRQEADEELKGISANALAGRKIAGITLLERLVYELKYFDETGDNLDKVNWTLCSGSRFADDTVPFVRWDGGRLLVGWCSPGSFAGDLRSRAVVLGERQRKAAEEEQQRQQAEAERKRKEGGNSIDSIIADWQSFWQKLGIKVDLSAVKIPEHQPGFSRILIIPQGLTLNQAIRLCENSFSVSAADYLDKAIVANDRLPTQTYAVCLRDRQEADEELKNLSAIALAEKKIAGITLLERLIYELKYFDETGDHLDKMNVTLCSGSHFADGDVPVVDWNVGRLRVYWYDNPGYTDGDLRSRAVVF